MDLLYKGNYWYRSGVTATMRTALDDITRYARSLVSYERGIVVLDIGSNDGTLLRTYPEYVHTIGFEPALNLQEEGSRGVSVLVPEMWSAEAYFKRTDKKAKIITAAGMFYDLDDPNKFIADVAKVLHPDGVFIAQLMCLQDMMDVNDIGNLAHEHLEFYTIRSLEYLMGKHGLEIFDIHTNSVNGQSTRLSIRHRNSNVQPLNQRTAERDLRRRASVESAVPDSVIAWFNQMELIKHKLWELIAGQAYGEMKSVWVYGASTKGNTLLQYFGLNYDEIIGAAERSPEKWGKVTAGTSIPIYSEEHARERNPDYFLVLPYAFIDEFIEREKDQEWRKRGGKFIVPLPELRVI
jgi:SAM-dependent methyltransferase